MSWSFRPGMKVVCVNDNWSPTYPGYTYPVEGRVYTILDVASEMKLFGTVYPGPWVAVDRVNSPGHGLPEFAAYCFRPLVERPTDISIFTAMLTPKRVEEPA